MVDHCVHMNGIPVSGDNLMGSYIGAAAYTGGGFDPSGKNNVQNDAEGLMCAESVGKRVAEMTCIINAGISALRETLPGEYFYTWEKTDSVVA
jgi:hypothetical protein